jgi:hypothetical protein
MGYAFGKIVSPMSAIDPADAEDEVGIVSLAALAGTPNANIFMIKSTAPRGLND